MSREASMQLGSPIGLTLKSSTQEWDFSIMKLNLLQLSLTTLFLATGHGEKYTLIGEPAQLNGPGETFFPSRTEIFRRTDEQMSQKLSSLYHSLFVLAIRSPIILT